MTEFFHVLVTPRDGTERLLLADLSRSDLERRLLKAYRRGAKFPVAGELVDPNELTGVRIIRTDVPRSEAMDRLLGESIAATDRLNADAGKSGVFLMGPLYSKDTDIEHAGEDVTGDFITAAPGSAKGLTYFLNHPWVLTIGAGLIVAALAALLFG